MASPAPNKIHSLPGTGFYIVIPRLGLGLGLGLDADAPAFLVLVRYHLPTASQTFSAVFSSPQQVYVHPSAGGEDEACGSIYLKTVVQGVLMASPEVFPGQSSSDLSLYVLDPRESSLRRSRSTPFSHLRPHPASSPSSSPSSPALPSTSGSSSSHEVWSGKGLLTWALSEPGQGKNLITGRLIRSHDFTHLTRNDLSPLEALVAGHIEDPESDGGWGIEISLALKAATPTQVDGMPGVHGQLASANASHTGTTRSDIFRRSSVVSVSIPDVESHSSPSIAPSQHDEGHFARPSLPAVPGRSVSHARVHPAATGAAHAPSQVPARGEKTPATKTRSSDKSKSTSGKKKRSHHSHSHASHSNSHSNSHSHSNSYSQSQSQSQSQSAQNRPRLQTLDLNAASGGSARPSARPLLKVKSGSSDGSSESFPSDIPAALYNKPESLTKEQAQRLLASPAFLSMLERVSGNNLQGKRRGGDKEEISEPAGKKQRHDHAHGHGHGTGQGKKREDKEELKCWNCGRTKSAVWRSKVMDDGTTVRVCNACGLYWNKQRVMRPPTLWQAVDEDVRDRPRKKGPGSTATPSSPAPMPKSEPATGSGGFKRTLSAAVNEDARRIATMRSARPRSHLNESTKPAPMAPMTSPLRASSSMTRSVVDRSINRKAHATAAVSSPGGWGQSANNDDQDSAQFPPSDTFQPVVEEGTTMAMGGVLESPNTAIRRILGGGATNSGVESLEMPLSDDGGKDGGPVDWTADLSAFFDVDAFNLPDQVVAPHEQSHSHSHWQRRASPNAGVDFGLNFAPRVDHGNTATTSDNADDDDVLSQLFHRTSSVGISSSPRFDFSALPPSSPPIIPADYSALLSSPDNSPISLGMGFSPLDSITSSFSARTSPEKVKSKSALARSFTPQDTILEDGEGESVTAAATAAVGAKGGVGVMPGQPIRSVNTTGTGKMFDGPATGVVDTDADAGLAGFSLEEVQKLLSDHPDLEALWNAVSTDPAQSTQPLSSVAEAEGDLFALFEGMA